MARSLFLTHRTSIAGLSVGDDLLALFYANALRFIPELKG